MNTLLLFACTLLVPLSTVERPSQFDEVVSALSIGDAQTVSTYFDNTVELVLPEVDDILPKAAAKKKLEAFFEVNKANSFARVHGGSSTGEEGAYIIGTLTTETGNFRVYMYGRGGASPIVQELRIEES